MTLITWHHKWMLCFFNIYWYVSFRPIDQTMGQEISHNQHSRRIHSRKKSKKLHDSSSIETGYYSNPSSCYYCSSSSSSSESSGLSTSQSQKSADKQKEYLNHHLYIKTYLDILEEDKRAKEFFQSEAAAKPGIRNYTPKILGENLNQTDNNLSPAKEELWIWQLMQDGLWYNDIFAGYDSDISNRNELLSLCKDRPGEQS